MNTEATDKKEQQKVDVQNQIQQLRVEVEKARQLSTQMVNNILDQTVPKEVLKNESFLEKIRLYLDNKGRWVKIAVGVIITILGVSVGITAEQLLDYINTGQGFVNELGEILTGLILGSSLSTGLLGGIFGAKAKKFRPGADIQGIDDNGKLVIKL